MSRPGKWTIQEFAVLAKGHALSHSNLSRSIGTRTPGAVEVVREGVHAYHSGQRETTLLSKSQKEYLDANSGGLTCWKCQTPI